jgi:hypothetical protein
MGATAEGSVGAGNTRSRWQLGLRGIAMLAAVMVEVVIVGLVSYTVGHSGSANISHARAVGARVGSHHGWPTGWAKGYRRGFSGAYRTAEHSAYKSAYRVAFQKATR